jgi:hypothetical protein
VQPASPINLHPIDSPVYAALFTPTVSTANRLPTASLSFSAFWGPVVAFDSPTFPCASAAAHSGQVLFDSWCVTVTHAPLDDCFH